jgi:hypothetical protein
MAKNFRALVIMMAERGLMMASATPSSRHSFGWSAGGGGCSADAAEDDCALMLAEDVEFHEGAVSEGARW